MIEFDHDWARMQTVKAMSRSVSQAQLYLDDLGGCAYRYYLSRVIRVWDRPAAWLPQGTAVHGAAEWWERGGRKASLAAMLKVYQDLYRKGIEELLEKTPNPGVWSASGRYEGQADILRRADIGAKQVEAYFNYYVNQKPGEVIWLTPDGTPAIELEFKVQFGNVWVRGYIDQIIQEITDSVIQIIVRDIKTGASPGGIFQLGTYRYAMMEKYDVDIASGDYWMGKNGRPTHYYNLAAMSKDQVVELYERTDEGIKAESFEPSPSPLKCGRCSVATSCKYAM